MQHYIKKIKEELFELKRWKSLVYTYPKLSLKEVDYNLYWKDKRGGGIGRLSTWQTERANIIISEIKKAAGSKPDILDVGCGDGSILKYVSDNLSVGAMYGADNSSFALGCAESFGVKSSLIDIADIDTLDKLTTADYVLLLEILEHVVNPEEVLGCMYKKAKRGVFFSFPNSGFATYRLRLLLGRFPLQWRLHPSEHVRFWTYSDLKWWLRELGYRKYTVNFYRGVPFLRKLWPALFSAAFVVHIPKQ